MLSMDTWWWGRPWSCRYCNSWHDDVSSDIGRTSQVFKASYAMDMIMIIARNNPRKVYFFNGLSAKIDICLYVVICMGNIFSNLNDCFITIKVSNLSNKWVGIIISYYFTDILVASFSTEIGGYCSLFHQNLCFITIHICYFKGPARMWWLQSWLLKTQLYWLAALNFTNISDILRIQHKNGAKCNLSNIHLEIIYEDKGKRQSQ